MKISRLGERRWCTLITLVTIVSGLLCLFIVYPILSERNGNSPSSLPIHNQPKPINWIDGDTPKNALYKIATDGSRYQLVFSDEFNKDGRTFGPGQDKTWEAVDLHYWVTGDYEWYHPDAISTNNGNLEIKITKENLHDLNYKSGMLQSWNKFCFTGGSIEVNVSLPGRGDVPGFWPAIWTMGNLGRAGYGATTEGTWPYTYDSCDIGVTKNQSLTNNLSWLPGQRLNKCVCKGQDHPSPGKGRAAPEIDIFEAAGVSGQLGTVSQSHQIAPFNANYNINDKYVYIYGNNTQMNSYKGAKLQQAVSAVTTVPPQFYEGKGYQTYGFEYEPGPNGYVTWLINGKPSFRLDAGAIGPDSMTKIAQRLISEEPMYVIMNLAISSGFGWVDFEHLPFPSTMRIDYVRLYQHPNRINVGCNPKDFPTSDYINKHINAYTNANLTTWAQAGYRFPTFKLDGTCPNPP